MRNKQNIFDIAKNVSFTTEQCIYILNRLASDAEYTEEDGVKTLHLNGTTSSYATTAAVDFGNKSFTIASWAKLKPSVNHTSVIISLWKNQRHFLFGKNSISRLRFVVKNKTNEKDIISMARG